MTNTAAPPAGASAGPARAPRSIPLPLLVTAGGIITAVSLGARSTFGLFLTPVVSSLHTGRATFALAIAIQNLVWGLSQPFAGAVADRWGSGRVLVFGSALYAAGLFLMAHSTTTGMLYLSLGLVVGVGIGIASFAVVLAAVGRMVAPARRSVALGIASAMGSVGQFVLVPLMQRLIDRIGWQHSAEWLAAALILIVVCSPVLRGRSADQMRQAGGATAAAADAEPVSLRHELRRAAHSRSFRLLVAGFFVCGFHVTFVATHLASYAQDIGQPRSIAADAIALIGLFNIFGSLAAGVLGARHSKARLLSLIYGTRAVVFAAFVLIPHSSATTLAFGAAIGVLWLSTVPLTSGIVVSQFGPTHAGTLFGIVFLSHQFGAFAGAYLGGTLADRAGSYLPVWWIAVALGVAAAVVHLFIDEGPQPEVPETVRVATRPVFGAAAALVVGVGLSGVLSLSSAAAADRNGPAEVAGAGAGSGWRAAFVCPLHLSPSS